METKTVYVNERARYGYRKSLNRNAILVFLYLHFCDPDSNGLIRMIDEEEIADCLSCHKRTIRNNLRTLADAGYIAYTSLPIPGYYNIFLSEYKQYFLAAANGGRGYFTLTKEMFVALCSLNSVNEVRLMMRGIITSDDGKTRTEEQSYKDYQDALPEYCTRNNVRKIAESPLFKAMFLVKSKKYTLAMKLKDEYSPAAVKEKLKEACKDAVRRQIRTYNDDKAGGKQKHLILSTKDLEDISEIAARYPLAYILQAVDEFYKSYIERGLSYTSVGALIRTMTKEIAFNHLAA